MELSINLWAVLIGIGALQGLVLSLFLILKGKGYKGPDLWFGLIIFIFSYCLLEFTLLLSGHIKIFVHIFTIYAPLLFLLGPFLLFYTKANVNELYQFKWASLLHFIPALLLVISFIPFYSLSANEKLRVVLIIIGSLYTQGNELPPNTLILNGVFFVQLSIYIILAKLSVAKIKKSTSVHRRMKRRVKNLIVLLAVFYAITLTTFILHTFPFPWRLQMMYSLMLCFSILIYGLSYRILFSRQGKEYSKKIHPGPSMDSTNEHVTELKRLLHVEKHFLNPDLSINTLSESMKLSSHKLSQMINQSFGTSFPMLVNELRVEEAKNLLQEDQEKKILAVALESGFSNQVNFIRVFKQFTGQTPSQFRDLAKN